jgi:hypothetical protein
MMMACSKLIFILYFWMAEKAAAPAATMTPPPQ